MVGSGGVIIISEFHEEREQHAFVIIHLGLLFRRVPNEASRLAGRFALNSALLDDLLAARRCAAGFSVAVLRLTTAAPTREAATRVAVR